MKTLILENGFVYEGKITPWELVFDALSQLTDRKTIEKLEKAIKGRVKTNDVSFNASDFTRMGYILKVNNGERYIQRLKAKMVKLNIQAEVR